MSHARLVVILGIMLMLKLLVLMLTFPLVRLRDLCRLLYQDFRSHWVQYNVKNSPQKRNMTVYSTVHSLQQDRVLLIISLALQSIAMHH